MIRSLKPKWNMLYPEEEKHKKMYGRRIRFNNDTIELNNLLKRLSKSKNVHSSPARKPWNYSAKNQFVVIKCRYSYNKKTHAMLLGASGLGKTHLMSALAYEACVKGYTAYFVSSTNLIESLSHARMQNKLQRKLTWLKKPHVLVIDEVGYENFSAEQANLFFQLVNARYEQGSIMITTNKPFGKWSEIMSDDAIATATLDRLLHHAHVISLKGDSYRMKDRIKTGVVDSLGL